MAFLILLVLIAQAQSKMPVKDPDLLITEMVSIQFDGSSMEVQGVNEIKGDALFNFLGIQLVYSDLTLFLSCPQDRAAPALPEDDEPFVFGTDESCDRSDNNNGNNSCNEQSDDIEIQFTCIARAADNQAVTEEVVFLGDCTIVVHLDQKGGFAGRATVEGFAEVGGAFSFDLDGAVVCNEPCASKHRPIECVDHKDCPNGKLCNFFLGICQRSPEL